MPTVCSLFSMAVMLVQIQFSLAQIPDEGLRQACKARRTEIAFPVISDASGISKLDDVSVATSQPRDLLHVRLKWRRKPLEIVLYKNQVTSGHTVCEWTQGNVTYAKLTSETCFYQGHVKGQRSSYVALSTCGGLSGYLQTDSELLFIHPGSPTSAPAQRQAHIVYTCERRQPATIQRAEWQRGASTATHQRRVRRSPGSPKYLEVQVVIDYSLWQSVGSKERTEIYAMTLMNIANTVFQHKSLGSDIRIVVVKIVFLEKKQTRDVLTKNNALNTVNKFCAWSKNRIPPGQPMDYDISILLTKEEFGPSGYAPITGLCNPVRSCAVIKDEGFTTGFVIAHESAHVFGLFHDGHGNSCHGRKYQTSIMAALVESRLNHFWWSECSKRRMQQIVNYLYCLNNKPDVPEDHFPLEAAETIEQHLGRPWSLDFQCTREFGQSFRLCTSFPNDPCNTLWCSSSGQGVCRTKRGPPLSGSSCGREKECLHSRCVYVGNERPIDGAWSTWASWSECSTDCGVGVKQRIRTCDDPAPAYEGKTCKGETGSWDTCADNTCDVMKDSRKSECALWDSLQIRRGTHKWQPFEGQDASSQCKQTCRSFYTDEIVTVDVNVADGSPCSYTTNNSNICLDGTCRAVGCDGKLKSPKRRDICGFCAGDGSGCKVVQGNITRQIKTPTKYENILTIPGGARNVRIEKVTEGSQFLALKDLRYGTHSLNGDRRQTTSKRLVLNGAMLEYTRGNGMHHESIVSSGPLFQSLQVQVYPRENRDPVTVFYSYTIHNSDFTMEQNMYKWTFHKWSDCSVTCGKGVQTILHICENKASGDAVGIELCNVLKQPRQVTVACSRGQCGMATYNFAMSNTFGECNATTCGESGVQLEAYTCERVFPTDNTRGEASLSDCDHLEPPVYTKTCKAPPCAEEEDGSTTTFHWSKLGDWSECPCGQGNTQTREVFCQIVEVKNGEEKLVASVNDDMCVESDTVKPTTSRTCDGKTCPPRYQWTESGEFTDCSANCGKEGEQETIMTCERIVRDEDGKTTVEMTDETHCWDREDPEPTVRNCTGKPCPEKYQWTESGEFTDCSATCGKEGEQETILTCERIVRDEDGKTTVEMADETHCWDREDPEPTVRNCTGKPCPEKYQWTESGEFTDCSASCGKEGEQETILTCERIVKDEDGKTTVEMADETHCWDREDPEPTLKNCTGKPCPEKYQWTESGEFTDCSASCGKEGEQETILTCERIVRDEDGKTTVEMAYETHCWDREDPEPTLRNCTGNPCPEKYQWTESGEFTDCSASCGKEGEQETIMTCERIVRVDDGKSTVEIADETHCWDREDPEPTLRNCTGMPCPEKYQWQATERWSDCNATCDHKGTHTRQFQCQKVTEGSGEYGPIINVSDAMCSDPLPSTIEKTRPCEGPLCTLKWTLEEWSSCSVTCGQGKMYRTVHCGDPDTDLDDFRCTDRPPITSQQCSKKPCKEVYEADCRDMYSFCTAYRMLRYRCKRSNFRRKCCHTCRSALGAAMHPRNALERYLMKRGLDRWARK